VLLPCILPHCVGLLHQIDIKFQNWVTGLLHPPKNLQIVQASQDVLNLGVGGQLWSLVNISIPIYKQIGSVLCATDVFFLA
jgi:hypothetical protein